MIAHIVNFSVERRWLVLLLTLVAAIAGVFALQRLPIDAVPDITNNQVQINVLAPALSPDQVEKQVAFTIETALAGIPGLDHTRSISRNGGQVIVTAGLTGDERIASTNSFTLKAELGKSAAQHEH